MKELRRRILMKLLGNDRICLSTDKAGSFFSMKGDRNVLAPLLQTYIENSPTFRELVLNASAEYLRKHNNEKVKFAKKIYEIQ